MCAETVKAAAVRCRFCGYDFAGQRMPAAPSEQRSTIRSAIDNWVDRPRMPYDRWRFAAVLLIAIFLLAAIATCDVRKETATTAPATESAAVPAPTAPIGEPELPAGVRRPTLQEFAHVLGASCPNPTAAHYKGESKGGYAFAVSCSSGDLLTTIMPDGSTTIVACSITQKLGENLCTARW
jgi:hypothetical protein